MPFGKSYRPNPASKGHDIECRIFYERDADFEKMCQAVPFEPGTKTPTAQSWWQLSNTKQPMLCTGVPTKKPDQRNIAMPMNGDRQFVPGDAPDTLIECRVYNHATYKAAMLKVVAPNNIPGMRPMAWWEAASATEGPATLCTGLVAVKGEAVNQIVGDGLEGENRARLETIAGTSGIGEVTKGMQDGEIIQKIREKRAGKTQKKEVAVVA